MEIFGCTATVIVLVTESGFPHAPPRNIEVERKIHRRGPRRVVERAARLLRRMQRIVSVEEHTREEYLRAYGDGTEHGPYRSGRGGRGLRRRDPLS
jgi:hypothetical protein